MKRSMPTLLLIGCIAFARTSSAHPDEGAASGGACNRLYVKVLLAARDAAARGDQRTAVARLKEARDVLALCRDGDPGSAETTEQPVHVLGRAEDVHGARG